MTRLELGFGTCEQPPTPRQWGRVSVDVRWQNAAAVGEDSYIASWLTSLDRPDVGQGSTTKDSPWATADSRTHSVHAAFCLASRWLIKLLWMDEAVRRWRSCSAATILVPNPEAAHSPRASLCPYMVNSASLNKLGADRPGTHLAGCRLLRHNQ